MARSAKRDELVKKLLEMQAKYTEIEQTKGVTLKDFYTADESSFLAEYRATYPDLAKQLVDMAHDETAQSHR